MKRDVFLRKIIRFALFALLLLIVFMLGRKIGMKNCETCPQSSACKGKSSCYI